MTTGPAAAPSGPDGGTRRLDPPDVSWLPGFGRAGAVSEAPGDGRRSAGAEEERRTGSTAFLASFPALFPGPRTPGDAAADSATDSETDSATDAAGNDATNGAARSTDRNAEVSGVSGADVGAPPRGRTEIPAQARPAPAVEPWLRRHEREAATAARATTGPREPGLPPVAPVPRVPAPRPAVDVAPTDASDDGSQVTPDVVADVTRNVAPDLAPDGTRGSAAGAVPDVAPDVTPIPAPVDPEPVVSDRSVPDHRHAGRAVHEPAVHEPAVHEPIDPAPAATDAPSATSARPRIEPDQGLLGLSRLTRGRVGSRLFTAFFVLVFLVIAAQLILAVFLPG